MAAGRARMTADRQALAQDADSLRDCRDIEADAANTYFAAWARAARCRFAERDLARIPEHWATFGARSSPLHTACCCTATVVAWAAASWNSCSVAGRNSCSTPAAGIVSTRFRPSCRPSQVPEPPR